MTGTLVYFVSCFLVRIEHKFLPVSNKEKCSWLSEGTSAHTAACMFHCVFVSGLSGGFKAGAVLCLVLHRDRRENHPKRPAEPEDGGHRLLHLSSVFVKCTKTRAEVHPGVDAGQSQSCACRRCWVSRSPCCVFATCGGRRAVVSLCFSWCCVVCPGGLIASGCVIGNLDNCGFEFCEKHQKTFTEMLLLWSSGHGLLMWLDFG